MGVASCSMLTERLGCFEAVMEAAMMLLRSEAYFSHGPCAWSYKTSDIPNCV